MQRVFEGWKRIGFFIKHSRSKVFITFSRFFNSQVKISKSLMFYKDDQESISHFENVVFIIQYRAIFGFSL